MRFIVKNTTIISPLDLVAPHSCRGCGRIGYALCDRCKNYIITHHQNTCPGCKKPNPTGDCPTCKNLPPTFVVDERKDLLDNLIHSLKYNSIRSLAKPLAEILDHALPRISTPVSIIPLPTINKHIRERGLDHTHLIAKHLAKLHPNYKTTKYLIRDKDTIQVGSTRSSRLSQAASAYKIAPHFTPDPSTTYILLDDVWTTGASLLSAFSLLKKAGAKHIIIAILAYSE